MKQILTKRNIPAVILTIFTMAVILLLCMPKKTYAAASNDPLIPGFNDPLIPGKTIGGGAADNTYVTGLTSYAKTLADNMGFVFSTNPTKTGTSKNGRITVTPYYTKFNSNPGTVFCSTSPLQRGLIFNYSKIIIKSRLTYPILFKAENKDKDKIAFVAAKEGGSPQSVMFYLSKYRYGNDGKVPLNTDMADWENKTKIPSEDCTEYKWILEEDTAWVPGYTDDSKNKTSGCIDVSPGTAFMVTIRHDNDDTADGSGKDTKIGYGEEYITDLKKLSMVAVIYKPFNYYLDLNNYYLNLDNLKAPRIVKRLGVNDVYGKNNTYSDGGVKDPSLSGYVFKGWTIYKTKKDANGITVKDANNNAIPDKTEVLLNTDKSPMKTAQLKQYLDGSIYYNNFFQDLYFVANWDIQVRYATTGGDFKETPYKYSDTRYYNRYGETNIISYGPTEATSKNNIYYQLIEKNDGSFNLVNVSSFGLVRTGYHIEESKAWNFLDKDGNGTIVSQADGIKAYSALLNSARIPNANGNSRNYAIGYPNWIPNTYTVRYNANPPKGKTATGTMSDSAFTYGVSKALTKNAYKVDGYIFAGWAKTASGAKSYNDTANVSNLTVQNGAVINLYAKWTEDIKEYKITFDANEPVNGNGVKVGTASNIQSDIIFSYNKNNFNSGKVKVPKLDGYKFEGYYIGTTKVAMYGADGALIKNINGYTNSTGDTILHNGNIPLKAHWTPYKATIIFDRNTAATTPKNIEGNPYSDKDTFTGDNYQVEIKYGEKFRIYTGYTRKGYKLLGYNIYNYTDSRYNPNDNFIAANSNGTVYYQNKKGQKIDTGNGNKTVKLYAIWVPIKYTVYYDKTFTYTEKQNINGDNYTTEPQGEVISYKLSYDEPIATPNTYTRKGYILKGYVKDLKNKADSAIYKVKTSFKNLSATDGSTVTLYAVWTPIKYTVKFNKNDITLTPNNINGKAYTTRPTGTVSDVGVYYDHPFLINTAQYTRTGYTLSGYAKDYTVKTATYKLTDIIKNLSATNNSTITLYAVWTPITYTVRYHNNLSKESAIGNKTVYFDSSFNLPGTLSRTKYKFAGWQIYSGANYNGYKNNTNTDPLTSNATLYSANSSMKNLRNTKGEVMIVAIWEHKYNGENPLPPAEEINKIITWSGNRMNSSNEYIYYTKTPKNKTLNGTTAVDGYYVNTNITENWDFNRVATLKSDVPEYIVISGYGYDEITSGASARVKCKNDVKLKNSNKVSFSISGNNTKLIKVWVTVSDSWNDAFTSTNNNITVSDTIGYTSVTGDCVAPEISDKNTLDNVIGIDKSQYTTYPISLYATDNGSGINDKTADITINNTDNKAYATLPLENNSLSSYGNYNKLKWKTFDLIKTDEIANNFLTYISEKVIIKIHAAGEVAAPCT